MNPIDNLSTARMNGTRLTSGDASVLRAMHANPFIMETLGGVRSAAQSAEWLSANLAHWDRYGYGIYVFRDRVDGRFIGRGGLRHVMVSGSDEVEVAYALWNEYWGRGLATEMAGALIEEAFERRGMTSLICDALVTNGASRRVMEKSGFRFEREFDHPKGKHALYRLTR